MMNCKAKLLLREVKVYKMNRVWNFNCTFNSWYLICEFRLLLAYNHSDHLYPPESTEKWSGKMLPKCCFVNFSGEEIRNLEN